MTSLLAKCDSIRRAATPRLNPGSAVRGPRVPARRETRARQSVAPALAVYPSHAGAAAGFGDDHATADPVRSAPPEGACMKPDLFDQDLKNRLEAVKDLGV